MKFVRLFDAIFIPPSGRPRRKPHSMSAKASRENGFDQIPPINSEGTGPFSPSNKPYSRLTSVDDNDEKLITVNETTHLLNSNGYHDDDPSCYVPRRHIITVLLFVALLIGYGHRTLMSITVEVIAEGTHWHGNETIQGLLLAAFFMGYIFTQIPSGQLCRIIGPKLTFAIGLTIGSLATLGIGAFGNNLPALFIMRILTGLGEGVLFPGVHATVGQWIPLSERITSLTFIWSGVQAGTLVCLSSSLPLIRVVKGYWQLVYIIWGCAGLVWVAFWLAFALDSPIRKPVTCVQSAVLHLGEHEKEKILKEVPGLSAPELPTPWLSFFKVAALWAIIAGHFSINWINYVLLGFLPKYLKTLHFDPGSWGLLPYVSPIIFSVGTGLLADHLITKRNATVVWVRRAAQIVGAMGVCLFLGLIAGLVRSDKQGLMAVLFLTFATGTGGIVAAGYAVNHMDIGPKYSGPLMGITNTAGTIPGIVGVFVTGVILDHTNRNYNVVWLLGIGILAAGTIIFVIFAKGKKIFE